MPKKPAKSNAPKAAAATVTATPPLRAVDRIRRSARELFYREGIRAVGVEEIVSQAGVTKRAARSSPAIAVAASPTRPSNIPTAAIRRVPCPIRISASCAGA
jgi:hypothetical protein